MKQDKPVLQLSADDSQALRQACKDFLEEYQPTLNKVENHLKKMMENTEPTYAQAYSPWLKGLRDICMGIYMLSKAIPLPDPAALLDALKMFSFESTIQLLHDICMSCKIKLQNDWIKKFHKDIETMLFAAATLTNKQSIAR